MLFLLTGEIQTGKTRWLERLVPRLAMAGTPCVGVVAPGVWQERDASSAGQDRSVSVEDRERGVPFADWERSDSSSGEPCSRAISSDGELGVDERSGEPCFEKIGINNLLLPQKETIPFARRRDLVEVEIAARVEEAGAKIETAAEAVVTAGGIEVEAGGAEVAAGAKVEATGGDNDAFVAGQQAAEAKLGWAISDEAIARVNQHFADIDSIGFSKPALLIVDELGRLELLHDRGLTEALHVLDAGPSPDRPHALVVVRASLVDAARERLAGAWRDIRVIDPTDEAMDCIVGLYESGLAE